jgi:hypothetical protein
MAKIGKKGLPGATGEQTTVQASTSAAVDQAIERAAEATSRMGRSERIHYWDKRQGAMIWVDADGKPVPMDEQTIIGLAYLDRRLPEGSRLVRSPDVILCGNDRSHGPLIIHGNGSVLLCQMVKNGAPCTFNQPVSV